MSKLDKKFNKSHSPKGFTLIEMMVAVSIFVIVAFIIITTLLTMSYAYKRAQKMRLIMDNFNFALQSMSLNIREGINYSPVGVPSDNIQFIPIDASLTGGASMCYSLRTVSGANGYVEKCSIGGSVSCPCSGRGSRFTSADINVKNLKFNIEGFGNKKKVEILIQGEAGVREKEKTSFFIQTTATQRNADVY